jgi:hypothetical protein
MYVEQSTGDDPLCIRVYGRCLPGLIFENLIDSLSFGLVRIVSSMVYDYLPQGAQ